MISPEQEEYILNKAYVPEQIVSLMSLISGGEPFLVDDYICFVRDNWLIFVGYPLSDEFEVEKVDRSLNSAIGRFQPEYARAIAPEMPRSILQQCQERESDEYYRFEVGKVEVRRSLMRSVEKTSKELSVARGKDISEEHRKMISDFLGRARLSHRVRALYLSMGEYVSSSKTSIVLNARDKEQNLSAFYIVDLAAKEFTTYVVGCYSRENYVPHASDLLFHEMLSLSEEYGKNYIHLGLGVNEGIRRFKKKWGGTPFLRYEYCEYRMIYSGILGLIQSLKSKL
jgi:hypothetical protein